MFQLKALFVRLYLLSAIVISATCCFQLFQGHFVYLGVLLMWLPLPLVQLLRLWRNVAWAEERETPLMLPALLGLAGVLLTEQHFSAPLWLALAGLFSLLLYLFVVTATPLSTRELEQRGDDVRAGLSSLAFVYGGERVTLADGQSRLVLFVHSAGPYSRMAIRQLTQTLNDRAGVLKPEQVVLISSVDIEPLCKALPSGVCRWLDPQGQSLEALGLLLRGGNWPLGDAVRPALAVVDGQGETRLWSVADNLRLAPCLAEAWPRLERALSAG